ncbi:MAG: hypothetical protein E7057_06625 [Lentisphaerae bacterium]|nr:hypothetical protein [Lentisphaerota bacterium]
MIRKLFLGTVFGGFCAASMLAADAIVWKFPAATAEWSKSFNCTVDEKDDAISVVPSKGDHGIICPKTDIDPSVYNSMRITYRAHGFKTNRTSGDLFFTTETKKNFGSTHRIKLPSLNVDGKTGAVSFRLDTCKEWKSAAKITSLRLDITDQIPGTVDIEKIELFAYDGNRENPVWDFADANTPWDTGDRLSITPENGELRLDITGGDSHIYNYFDRFDGSKYTKLKVTYRAEGFKRTTGGFFFIATGYGRQHFSQNNFFKFPSLISDGKEHSFTINVKLPPAIHSLRFDIVDQFPGKVWIRKIEFLP